MRSRSMFRRCAPLAVVLAGCATHRFPPQTSSEVRRLGPEGSIEMTLTRGGRIAEVEFHVAPSALPSHVLRAMNEQFPGGEVTGAEVEYVAGVLHYEVTKRVEGRDMEVMFDEQGNPVRWELEVEENRVPKAVLEAAMRAAPGTLRKVEEIRDADRRLVAYHVKKEDGGIRYKIEIAPEGRVVVVLREVPAEIEVPLE